MPKQVGKLGIPTKSGAPASPFVGQAYFDLADNKFKVYDGTSFKEPGGVSAAVRPYLARRLHRLIGGSLADSGSNNLALSNGGGAALSSAPAGYSGIEGWTFTQTAVQRLTEGTGWGLPAGTTPRTMGAIITTTSTDGSRWLMSYGAPSGESCFEISLNTGNVSGKIALDTWTSNRVTTAGGTGFNNGNPHLLVATYDSGTVAIVMDGTVLASASVGPFSTTVGSGYVIGGILSGGTTGNSFIGNIWLPGVLDYAADPRDLTIAKWIAMAAAT